MICNKSRAFITRLVGFAAVVLSVTSLSWAASNGKIVYSFTGGNDGSDPAMQLVFDSAGNGYGTTVTGGAAGCGTVVQLGPNGQLTTLYSFSCLGDGKNPYGGVTLDSKGDLYGTTVAGGIGGACAGDGCGVVYTLTKSGDTWTQSVLYNFTGGNDGFGPGGSVVFDSVGNLYGSTPDGGANGEGVVYQLSPTRGGGLWNLTVIHAFTGGADGAVGSLGALLFSAGKFYGISELGGTFGAGTVFELSPASGGGWTFTTVHQFQGMPHAGFPYGGLISDSSGRLFGTTYFGGTSGQGAVYMLSLVKGSVQESILHNFSGGSDGSNPTSTPAFDAHGNLYVTTSAGGNPGCGCGTVLELAPSGGGVKSIPLHAFGGSPDGGFPSYGLTLSNNAFFGSTPVGGTKNQGMIFSFTP